MAQMTASLARAVLSGGGVTRNELEQLCRRFLKSELDEERKDRDFLRQIVERARGEEGYFEYVALAAQLLPTRLREQLYQLVHGPVWDGNIISKQDRSELFDLGLAIRVCHKGEQGYTGAVYFGYSIIKKLDYPNCAKAAAFASDVELPEKTGEG